MLGLAGVEEFTGVVGNEITPGVAGVIGCPDVPDIRPLPKVVGWFRVAGVEGGPGVAKIEWLPNVSEVRGWAGVVGIL